MNLKFHHLNLCSQNTPAMDDFYRNVLGLKTEPTLAGNRIGNKDYPGHVAFVTDGALRAQEPARADTLSSIPASGRGHRLSVS